MAGKKIGSSTAKLQRLVNSFGDLASNFPAERFEDEHPAEQTDGIIMLSVVIFEGDHAQASR